MRPPARASVGIFPGQIFQKEVSLSILFTYRCYLSAAPRFSRRRPRDDVRRRVPDGGHGARFPYADRLLRAERAHHRRACRLAVPDGTSLSQHGELPGCQYAREHGHAVRKYWQPALSSPLIILFPERGRKLFRRQVMSTFEFLYGIVTVSSVVVLLGMFLYEMGIVGMVQAFLKEVRHRP